MARKASRRRAPPKGTTAAERTRREAETRRETAEGQRAEAERGRIHAEDLRQLAEKVRADAEQTRRAAEDARKALNETRRLAEELRRRYEQQRKVSEDARREAAIRARADIQRMVREELEIAVEMLKTTVGLRNERERQDKRGARAGPSSERGRRRPQRSPNMNARNSR